ncbi:efflux RND transporter permease subunit [Diaminobutyricimonas sp. LJ205]|uniref:efflux RND transporter permease subunit n=1 Tax=Diaminobutyricimonas sp. LJ205 TaxID=2683590 RepID=UPI0012F4BD92|nr:efflux RND transporter permease subunit [Diaminobutyricimonas sp. LJ205]
MHLLSVFSLRNRALIALVTIVVGIFGFISLNTLKQELIPSVSFPQVVVLTTYPGAAPEVVNEDVSTPIETAIQGVTGLESTTATSSTDLSFVSASFEYGTDLVSAEQKVQLAINRLASQLPADVEPQVVTGSLDDLPVVQIAVTSDLDQRDLSAALAGSAIADITALDNVREASLLGETGQRVTITPDVAQLASAGLSVQSIRDALDANGVLLPAGSITEGDSTLSVQAGERLNSAAQLAALPLIGGSAVTTIGDVASVEVEDNPVTGISRVNGEPALTIAVTKMPDGNTVDVSHAVQDLMPELEESLGNNTEFTVVFDQAPFIEQSIEALATEGMLGLVFAVLIILIFLGSIRSTLVTAISIPVSVLITFIGMQAANYTLNILTLGALTIAIGRVVDDSIVVIENIKRHLGLGENRMHAIRTAVREVATAITSSTVTTVAVFLPLALVGDITGELFRPFALTVTIALGASLFVALTIVPVLAYWFLGKKADRKAAQTARLAADTAQPAEEPRDLVTVTSGHAAASASPVVADPAPAIDPVDTELDAPSLGHGARRAGGVSTGSTGVSAGSPNGRGPRHGIDSTDGTGSTGGIGSKDELDTPTRLQKAYLPVIHWTIKRPAVTLLAAALVLGGTIALVPSMKTNFIGESGQNTLSVSQTLPLGASLETMDAAAGVVEDELLAIDGIETVQTSIGSSGSSLLAAFGGGGDITYSITTDPDVDQAVLQQTVRDELDALEDVGDIEVAATGGGFASSTIDIDIKANSHADLQEAADALLATVSDLGITAEATSNLSETQPYIAVVVDRAKAAEVGLSEIAVGGMVSQAMQPSTVGSAVIDEKTMSIYIGNSDAPTTVDELRGFVLPTAAGPLPLEQVASIDQVDGPASITTIRGVRAATVSVTPNSDDVGTASAEVQAAVDEVDLPAGATAELGGVTAQQGDAFTQLSIALLVAILIVYIVMVATFRSLRQPLLLLISVPFAATGAILLQVVSGVPLGVPSLIGVLMLIGIVVTNAIVLIDLVNQYRDRGMLVGDAVVHGASRRLRPILMTALATIFALVPMAFGLTGHGGFISQPLAIVVIGGLISSTFLTLVVLPALYYLVEGARERREARRAALTE